MNPIRPQKQTKGRSNGVKTFSSKSKSPLTRFIVFSSVFHLFLFGTNYVFGSFYASPQFAIEVAPTSMDVAIIEEMKDNPPQAEDKITDILTVQENVPENLPKEEVKKSSPKEEAKEVSDKETPEYPKEVFLPGESKPEKGALKSVSPDYMRNPAPRYPQEARQRGWQGVVVLNVLVNAAGYSTKVEVDKGSGHIVLDQEALKTVQTWRFRPARMGNIRIESLVLIPIRFSLEMK